MWHYCEVKFYPGLTVSKNSIFGGKMIYWGTREIDERYLDPESVDTLKRVAKQHDDDSLDSSPCEACGFKRLPWAYEFCSDCGVRNTHYDPRYRFAAWPCDSFHQWLVGFLGRLKEMGIPKHESHCHQCGMNVL